MTTGRGPDRDGPGPTTPRRSPFRRAAVEFHATRDRGTRSPTFAVPHAKYVAGALLALLVTMGLLASIVTIPTFARVPVVAPSDRGSLGDGRYVFALAPAGKPMPLVPGRRVRVLVPDREAVDLRVASVARRVDRAELGTRFGVFPPESAADRTWSVAVVPWESGAIDPPGEGAHFSVRTGRQTVAAYVVGNGRPTTSAPNR